MADDLLFHRVAHPAVGPILQVAVGRGVAGKGQQCAVRAVGKIARLAKLIERLAEEQVVAVIKEQRLIVRQAFRPAQGGYSGALRHFGQGHDFGIGVIGFDFPVNGMVADMLLQHHKGDIGTVHKFGNALGCPIEKRAVVDLDQGLGHHKTVFKKAAAAPGHRHYKVQLCHVIPLSHRGQPAWRTRSRSRGAGPRGCRSSVPSHSTLWRGCYRTGNTC